MRLGPAAIAALLVGLAPILSACGGGETTASGIGEVARTTTAQSTAPAVRDCSARLRGFIGKLDLLRRNLAVGMSYDSYLGEVEGARDAYAAIPVEGMRLDCLTLVGNPGERALNEYIEGVNTWGDCLARASCNPVSIEAELKHGWEVASGHLSLAGEGRRKLRSS